MLDGNPHVDEVVEFPRRDFRGFGGALRLAPWARKLRERFRPDLVLDYQGLLRSALISRLCRADESRVVGLSDAREGARFFYDEAVDVSTVRHAVDRYLALTTQVTQAPVSRLESLEWPLPAGTKPDGFHQDQPFVILHPFSRGAGKSLAIDDILTFCRSIHPHPVVIAGRAEVSLPALDNLTNLVNQTSLSELVWLLRMARFIVSVDSGPMHIASALTDRLVSIHTWSDPAKVGPYRPSAWIWQKGQLFQQQNRDSENARQEITNISALAEFVRAQL